MKTNPQAVQEQSLMVDDSSLTDAQIRMIRHRLLKWGLENFKPFPWRSPSHQWHGLVAEVLLQRTRAKNVVPVYESFISRFSEVEDLEGITEEEVQQIIYPLGLRWRAPLLRQLCEWLVQHKGKVPDSYEELLKLPAVGPYVAAVTLSFHCGKRGVIIDANVVRWLCRLVDRPMDGETRRDKWLISLADRVTPHKDTGTFNYAILDFTMEICSTKPHCAVCPIGPKLCKYGKRLSSGEGWQDPAPETSATKS